MGEGKGDVYGGFRWVDFGWRVRMKGLSVMYLYGQVSRDGFWWCSYMAVLVPLLYGRFVWAVLVACLS